ncbi:hypothetical protein RGR602_PB00043 (plasmid) [Rhizobium gallicum bv. gallicum R602sp]|uniref:Uncharacterized protein n=1 Tax=Rhizobium gallicum bv. gallicum R602sp TaxID=1041138 RepID=A0A0B4X672_9HYPH|nr:hypothetical protein RGR602_PB00043 [Rhizobium gallicum bv. gallicum R602sp]
MRLLNEKMDLNSLAFFLRITGSSPFKIPNTLTPTRFRANPPPPFRMHGAGVG